MANPGALALTDDEAVTIALLADGNWRPPLPTIDEGSDAGLTSALARGRRSLIVRELAGGDGTLYGAAAQVRERLGSAPCAGFLLIDAEGHWVPSGVTIYLYGAAVDDVQMSHIISAAGVHHFQVPPASRQWYALTELAEAVFADGLVDTGEAGQQPVAALLLAAGPAGTVRSVRVAKGSVSIAQGPITGTFPHVPAAVAWLVG
jgi:hypothetical protein